MIELSPAAAEQILAATQHLSSAPRDPEQEARELALRVAAWPGPDGDIEYGMGFDEEREGDLAICVEGVALLIGAPSRAFLIGTQLDYVEYQPGDFRFIFIPPEAGTMPAASCGSAGGTCGGCSCKG